MELQQLVGRALRLEDVAVERDELSECELGDWVSIMDAPGDWELSNSPCSWVAPDGAVWHFGWTEAPTVDHDGDEGEVGSAFVWMRFDPAGPPPPPRGDRNGRKPPRGPEDPTLTGDWWKSQ